MPLEQDNVVRIETIYVCPECGHRYFEVVSTCDTDGPVCRCLECAWGLPSGAAHYEF